MKNAWHLEQSEELNLKQQKHRMDSVDSCRDKNCQILDITRT